MGNPFGKIIQNGVEYDVSPYAHKIEVNYTNGETYRAVLTRLHNALASKVSDFRTIKDAKLVRYRAGSNAVDYHMRSTYPDFISFFNCAVSSSSAEISEMGMQPGNGSYYYRTNVSAPSSISFTDASTQSLPSGSGTFTLYYS